MEFEEFETEPLDDDAMRLENEILKLRLRAEYDAIFPEAQQAAADPEEEYVFLKRVLQLHQRIANTPPRPLRDVLNFREFPPADELSDEAELSIELMLALEYLEESNILVDFECEYPDRTMYDFITKELPLLEVIGCPADDEYICIVYEAFHPNAAAEIEAFCEEFFIALFTGSLETEYGLFFPPSLRLIRLRERTKDALLALVNSFLEYFQEILLWELTYEKVRGEISTDDAGFGDGFGMARGTLHYEVRHHDGSEQPVSGPFVMHLYRQNGLWWLLHFEFHGFSWDTTRAAGKDEGDPVS